MNNKKVSKVMHEFKTGSLKSSSGQKVTNPKQGIAIALSEARRSNKGGEMRESKAIVKKEIEYMKKGKAPKSLISHEKKEHAEMGMNRGGVPKKMARGGEAAIVAKKAAAAGVRAALRPAARTVPTINAPAIRPAMPVPVARSVVGPTMKKGGATSRIPLSKKQRDLIPGPKMSAGGYTKAADGVAKRGLTKGKMLRKGGKVI